VPVRVDACLATYAHGSLSGFHFVLAVDQAQSVAVQSDSWIVRKKNMTVG